MAALKPKLLPLAAALAAAITFFWPFFASHGDTLSGDLGDNRLHLVILEHWRAVVAGQAPALSPNFFAPVPGVLAYSDALLLFVPPYLLLRALTLEPHLAYQLTLVALKILAFLALFALLRRAAGLSPALAAWAAALFALSNVYSVSLGHGQLASHAFLPLILWLARLAWDLLPTRPLAAHSCAAAAAALFGLLFFTAYYIAFFFGLTLGLCLAIFFLLDLRQPAGRFPWRRALPLTASSAAVFTLSLAPFLITYLPLLHATGGRTWSAVQDQTLGLAQLISPGAANFLWGAAVEDNAALFQLDALRESGRGWPPITACLFLLATLAIWRRPKPTPAHRLAAAACLSALLLAVAATACAGLYPWRLIHYLVPGASGVRVPQRINLVLNLAVVIVLATFLRAVFQKSKFRPALAALLLLVLIEQLNWNAHPGYSRQADRAFLDRIPPPPPSCRSFYSIRSPRLHPTWIQVDAMLLARRFNIPTLHGYSGITPPGWRCDTNQDSCALSLQSWASLHNLSPGLCTLDITTATWTAGFVKH
ncbi:MAG: hypothetical protein IPP47_29230 [Bryobacterales bacterium]|nr:hypothetical protein [Bryobacterales bacterium]